MLDHEPITQRAVSRQIILDNQIIAIMRDANADGFVEACHALVDGGVRVMEITLNTQGALEAIEGARQSLPEDVLIGGGTVLSTDQVRAVVGVGGQFIVSPNLDLAVVEECARLGVPVLPGAMTPTEIQLAWSMGADLVKVFPAEQLGPKYIKNVLAPLSHLKLAPTGGVDIDNIGQWLSAGAAGLGIGSNLVSGAAAKRGAFDDIRETAATFVAARDAWRAENI